MDPYLHTAIAVGLLAAAYFIGRYLGKEDGILFTWGIIMDAFDAKEIEIDDEGDLIVTYNDNTKEKLN